MSDGSAARHIVFKIASDGAHEYRAGIEALYAALERELGITFRDVPALACAFGIATYPGDAGTTHIEIITCLELKRQ